MRIRSSIALAIVVAGCASRPSSRTSESRVDSLSFSRLADPGGEMTPDRLRALAPRVAAIRPEVDSVTIAPGESFNALRYSVRLLDSTGATLGQTRIYDFGLAPGAATMDPPPLVRGVTEGVTLLRISYPKRMWVGRTDAPVESVVRIIVRPR